MAAKAEFEVRLPERDLKKLIELMRDAGKQAGMAENEVDNLMDEIRTGSKKASPELDKLNKKFDGLNKMGGTLLKTMGAAFAVDKLMDMGKKVLNVTANFDKMIAVLTTGLGSKSEAQAAFAQILQFAKTTPFQVDQITESYVKMVNRGIKPGNRALKAMGDFASASGKDMGQLVEAILDVNNTERWTELGLKVKTNGDKITGTFKGMTVEAERTEAGALKMVQAFGEMEGVTGSMAGISETLAGKLSNLDDGLDQLSYTIGNASRGPMNWFIEKMIAAVDATNDFFKTLDMHILDEAADKFQVLGETIDQTDNLEDLNKLLELYRSNINYLAPELEALKKANDGGLDAMADYMEKNNMTLGEMEAHYKDTQGDARALEMAVDQLTRKIKMLSEANKKTGFEDFKKKGDEAVKSSEEAAMRAMGHAKSAVDGWAELEQIAADIIAQGAKEVEDADKDIIDSNEKVVEEYKKGVEEQRKAYVDYMDSVRAESERMKEYMREDFYVDLAEYAVGYFNSVTQIANNSNQRQIQALDKQRDYELSLAGDNADGKQRINEEYDKKIAALKAKQAQREQRAALFEIATQTAINAVKLFAATVPPGLLSAVAIGFGALQAGVILSDPIPAFKDGVVDFKGKGTETSDDNLVRISHRESISTALATKKFSKYLSAFNDPSFTEKDLHEMVLKQLPEGVSMPASSGYSPEVLQELRALRQAQGEIVSAINDKEHVNINLDGHTYAAEFRKSNNKKKYLSQKFGFKL